MMYSIWYTYYNVWVGHEWAKKDASPSRLVLLQVYLRIYTATGLIRSYSKLSLISALRIKGLSDKLPWLLLAYKYETPGATQSECSNRALPIAVFHIAVFHKLLEMT